MKTLLRIDSSLRLKNSCSRNAGDNFVQAWKKLNPGGSINIREVGASHIPHLEQGVLEKFYTAGDTSDCLKLSDQLIAELFGCDEILITVPTYNFGIPSSLKAYFDLVLRTGKTFRYDEDKAIGLLQNKKTYIFSAKGEPKSAIPNLVEMHLQQILNFIGIREIYYYSLEGTDDKESVKQQLNRQKELFTNILNK
ncbi:FMN-dependent NADH-azoreductase [Sphingobacterium athyrii]|uniref:FMN-dependent NADH-azoreductase n=1 Tax=Sphingobacterium athyrii TaxID=2152717 RepID=UPI0028B0FDC4|nr:NAD(P)H-dependent oxidoreductase [Sphingobacterium athyrii]